MGGIRKSSIDLAFSSRLTKRSISHPSTGVLEERSVRVASGRGGRASEGGDTNVAT